MMMTIDEADCTMRFVLLLERITKRSNINITVNPYKSGVAMVDIYRK